MSAFQILCVDDNENDRELIRLALARLDREVTASFARDGLEALEILERQAFHLVITDLKMPRMDGIELVRTLRTCSDHWSPVVMFTTSVAEQDVRRAYQVGCSAFHVKPLGFKALRTLLLEILDYWSAVTRPGREKMYVVDVVGG